MKVVFWASSTACAVGLSLSAHAATLSVPFEPGSGNTNTDFVLDTSASGNVEVALKGKLRFFGQTGVTQTGSTYTVPPGFSPVSGGDPTPDPTRAAWNFDYSIKLGNLGGQTLDTFLATELTNKVITLTLDFDETLSNTVQAVTSFVDAGFGPVGSQTFVALGGPGYVLGNPSPVVAPEAFVVDTDTVVLQGSQNFSFGNFAPFNAIFDALDTGATYDLSLSVTDSVDSGNNASTSITVQTVPEPMVAGLAFAGLSLLGMRRFRVDDSAPQA